jgi:D-glycero-D-manno-heptose 1,7-bisphosphate phosphatase
MRSAAFLDRDGVLNKPVPRDGSRGSPRSLREFELVEGAGEAVRTLRNAGLLVIVVTNQPDVSRGLLDPAELNRIHDRLRDATTVDAIYTCPHDDQDVCSCRKPRPGLLLRAAAEWDISIVSSFMIGDTWKDIAAGSAVGCKTFLVGSLLDHPWKLEPSYKVRDLRAAAEIIAALRPRKLQKSHSSVI